MNGVNQQRQTPMAARAFATACALIVGFGADLAPAGEVRIWPTAVVTSGDVTMGHVSEFVDFTGDIRRLLERAVVSPSPCEGGESLVSIEDVRRALTEAGANLSGIQIVGASRCKVSRPLGAPRVAASRVTRQKPDAHGTGSTRSMHRRKTQTRDDNLSASGSDRAANKNERTLETVLREYIATRLADQPGRVDVQFSAVNRDDLAMSAESDEFHVQSNSVMRPGLVTLEVEAKSTDGASRRIPIVAEVALWREIVVARRAINRGRAIEAADLAVQERRFTDASGIGLTQSSAAVGQRAKEFVPPGQMLSAGMIEAAPVVERGDAVTIWIRRGGVVVKTSGKAQQAGGLGDVISVRRDGTKRKQDLIDAVVTGPGTVTISETPRLASR